MFFDFQLTLLLLVVIAQTSLDWVARAGTLPMQCLLLFGIFILGCVLKKLHVENKFAMRELLLKLEAKDTMMTAERLERIKMLIELVRDDGVTKTKMTLAIENNTAILKDLQEVILRTKLKTI